MLLATSERISPLSLLLCLLAAFATFSRQSNGRRKDASPLVFWIQPLHAFVVTPPLAFKPKIRLFHRTNDNDPPCDVNQQPRRNRNVRDDRPALFSSITIALRATTTCTTCTSQQHHQEENATAITTSSTAVGSPIITTTTTKSTSTKGYQSVIQSQRPSLTSATHLQMVSFYRFVPITPPAVSKLVHEIFDQWSHAIPGLRGSVYLATEGINGQLAIPVSAAALPELFATLVEQLLESLEQQQQQQQDKQSILPTKSESVLNWGDVVPIDTPTFERWIVRTRNAILRDGLDEYYMYGSTSDMPVLDWNHAGDELSPSEWHDALMQPSPSTPPLILDCRNDYESAQGTFQNAIPLNTTTFSESWNVLEDLLLLVDDDNNNNTNDKNKPIYIFCTGGIRCVKVGAFLTQTLGYQNVKRLQHGIIGYQKYIHSNEESTTISNGGSPDQLSLWKGEKFLFDKRRFAKNKDTTMVHEVPTTNDEQGERKRNH